MYGSWDTKWDTEWDRHNFLSFWVIFALLPLYQPEKITILQSEKNPWRYMAIIWCMVSEIWRVKDKIFVILCPWISFFTLMYHKWWSYKAWLLRYEVWQAEFTVILGYFLPFYPTNNLKNKKYKKKKKNTWRYHHFTLVYNKWRPYDVWFLRYGAWQTFFSHFRPFFAILPPKNVKKSGDTII